MTKRFTAAIPLMVVLLLAVLLRFSAIGWGGPFVYHPDEHLIVHPALNIVRTRDLNPHWFQYPSLLIYFEAALVTVCQPWVGAPLSSNAEQNHIGPWDVLPAQWPFVLAGRCLVAALAVLGIGLTYWVAARLGGPATGFAAALFLVASPLHNESSHYLTTDVPATTLLTATLLASVRCLQQSKRGDIFAAGLFAGLAAATKYTAGIAIVVPLGLLLTRSAHTTFIRWALLGSAALIGFLLACPYAVLDWPSLLGGILEQRRNYLGGYTPGGNWLWYLDYLYAIGLGAPLAILCAAGLLITPTLRRRRLHWILAALCVGYFAFYSSYPSRAERNLILLLPLLCLLAADLLVEFLRRLMNDTAATIAACTLATVIAAPGLQRSIANNQSLSQPDTRTLAAQWIDENVPNGRHIAREEYTPQVDSSRYAVTYEWSLAMHHYAWYVANEVDYLVVSSNVYGRVLNPPYIAVPAEAAFYQFVFDRLPLLQEINPAPDHPGPTIRIYGVPRGQDDF
ncbi:MAG: glycosyltransferase family 39 protein [Deltaproteobacteria bacterium]|nr:glycosyltransferase family 39 protein [Deltaproteobacteria bacterium]